MSHSRYNSIGLSGGKSSYNNSLDTYIKTYEIPVFAVASSAAQDTGINAPTKFFQVISAVLNIDTAEATGTTKTITLGVTDDGDAILSATNVSATGVIGAANGSAVAGGGNFTYTLGSDDFAELDAKAVVTLLCADE
jgi:hypothetical protein